MIFTEHFPALLNNIIIVIVFCRSLHVHDFFKLKLSFLFFLLFFLSFFLSQVDKIAFGDTQDVATHPGLQNKHADILLKFGFVWANVEWVDLRKPLYSALAARLYLSNIPAVRTLDYNKVFDYNYHTHIKSNKITKAQILYSIIASRLYHFNRDSLKRDFLLIDM